MIKTYETKLPDDDEVQVWHLETLEDDGTVVMVADDTVEYPKIFVRRTGENFEYVVPSEGLITWIPMVAEERLALLKSAWDALHNGVVETIRRVTTVDREGDSRTWVRRGDHLFSESQGLFGHTLVRRRSDGTFEWASQSEWKLASPNGEDLEQAWRRLME